MKKLIKSKVVKSIVQKRASSTYDLELDAVKRKLAASTRSQECDVAMNNPDASMYARNTLKSNYIDLSSDHENLLTKRITSVIRDFKLDISRNVNHGRFEIS